MQVSPIGPVSPTQSATFPTAAPAAQPAKAAPAFGSTPAAALTISSQARALAAKAAQDKDHDGDSA